MNTKDSCAIVGVHTQAAVNRLKEYLLTTIYSGANVEYRSDMLFVIFEDGTQPSDELIDEVRKLFYWTDKLKVPHIDGFVHYYEMTNTLLINLVHYDEICRVCEKLKSFGVDLKGFDLSFKEYTFTYDVHGRSPLRYPELLEIEQIVKPEEKEILQHLSVFRMDVFYTITIKHHSWNR